MVHARASTETYVVAWAWIGSDLGIGCPLHCGYEKVCGVVHRGVRAGLAACLDSFRALSVPCSENQNTLSPPLALYGSSRIC